jgi:hypothetical protein
MPKNGKGQTSRKASGIGTDIRSLERLVGAWRLSGEAKGLISYEWAEGGNFLLQRFDIEVFGRNIRGIEVIGRLRPHGEEPSREIWSRAYSFLDGLTLDYVYELLGETLIIWFRRKGSDNRMTGSFGPGDDTLTGAWAWPGGGYRFTWTRVNARIDSGSAARLRRSPRS